MPRFDTFFCHDSFEEHQALANRRIVTCDEPVIQALVGPHVGVLKVDEL